MAIINNYSKTEYTAVILHKEPWLFCKILEPKDECYNTGSRPIIYLKSGLNEDQANKIADQVRFNEHLSAEEAGDKEFRNKLEGIVNN